MSSSDLLPPLHRAILLTVLYGDLFDHPLKPEEIRRFLPLPCPEPGDLEQALDELSGRWLSVADGFVCWRGRESTFETRRRRQELSADRWPAARRFARWLSRVPFLRMVAVCGSQAMENGDERADVDLFLITEPDRLWLVQSAAMVLRRAGRLLGVDFCPNYLLTTRSLEIEERDLYAAREAVQVVPLWGEAAYDRFLAANRWIESFLPQHGLPQHSLPQHSLPQHCLPQHGLSRLGAGDRRRFLESRSRQRSTGALEWLFGGWLGTLADRGVHRLLLVYYRLRLRRHGWSRGDIESAYRRDRQVVITGGYSRAVAERFLDHAGRELGDRVSRAELERWFFGDAPTPAEDREAADPLYAGLMARRYGGSC